MPDKVEELRDELRHKRVISPSEDGGGAVWNERGNDTTSRSGYQDAGGDQQSTVAGYGQTPGIGGSAGENSLGVGQTNRRPSGNNSSVYNGTPTPTRRGRRTAGRIEADDDVPVRIASGSENDYYVSAPKKRGRRKALPVENIPVEPVKQKRSIFRVKTLPFTEAEADAKREPLAAALTDIFKYTDEYLWWVAEDELKQPVWSDVDDEEMEKLLGALLGQAQESAVGAAVVNNIILAANYIALGGITIPRLARTLKLLGTAQIKRKQKRQLEVVK